MELETTETGVIPVKITRKDVFLRGLYRSVLTCVQRDKDPFATLETAWWTAAHYDYTRSHCREWYEHYIHDHASARGYSYGVYQAVSCFIGDDLHEWSLTSPNAARNYEEQCATAQWRNRFTLDLCGTPLEAGWSMTRTPTCQRSPVRMFLDVVEKDKAVCLLTVSRVWMGADEAARLEKQQQQTLEAAGVSAVREVLATLSDADPFMAQQAAARLGHEGQIDALFRELLTYYYLAAERLGAISKEAGAPTIPHPLIPPTPVPSPLSSPPSTP